MSESKSLIRAMIEAKRQATEVGVIIRETVNPNSVIGTDLIERLNNVIELLHDTINRGEDNAD